MATKAVRPQLRMMAAVLVLTAAVAGCSAGDPPRADQTAPAGTSGPVASGPVPSTPAEAPDPYAAGLSRPVADKLYPGYGNASLDVLHYGLDLAWAPGSRTLSGTATVTLRAVKAVRQISLDFSRAFTLDQVSVDGARVTAKRSGHKLVLAKALPAGARATLVVRYHGSPRPESMPGWSGWTGDGMGLRAMGNGEAWSIQQPVGAFTWYPVNDHPSDEALYDIAVTVPKGWTGIATGQLVESTSRGSRTTWRWRSTDPAASYATTLVIGRYEKHTATGPGRVPVTVWLRAGADDHHRSLVKQFPAVLRWLADRFGPYPFPAAGVVVVDSRSAMETQQMITIGSRSSGGQSLLLHEVSHEWFGNAVTPRDWTGIWLSEGIATWIVGEWAIDRAGASRRSVVDGWRAEDRAARATAGPPGRPRARHFGARNVYASPALMLHEIRSTIGAAAFERLLRDWVQTQRHESVDRETFVRFVNAHTGRDLSALINTWLDSASTPAG
ncbi:M1 family metallopeptidase [Luedemannella helvata]